jgi:ribonucleoside-diphosphate reductase beta chain
MIFDKQIALKPDHYPWTREFIDAMWKGHWTPDEFSFHGDYNDYKQNIDDRQRLVVRNTLSAIGQIEIAVKTFWAKLGENLPHPSLNDLGITMANIEVIHNRAYVKLLDVLHLDHVFEENLKLPVIEGRVNYLRKYTERHYKDSRQQYVYALILFTAIIENVSLFSQFYTINSFNKAWKLFKDADQQVKYTAKEELSHALAGVRIVNQIREEHPELFNAELNDRIMQEMTDAAGMETRIIEWMLGDFTANFQGVTVT